MLLFLEKSRFSVFLIFYVFMNSFLPGHASPANFKSDPSGASEDSFTLEWTVESITPVTEFSLQLRQQTSDDSWEDTTKLSVSASDNGDNFYSGRWELSGLEYATHYEARVASKNAYGFGDYNAEPFVFATRGAGDLDVSFFLLLHVFSAAGVMRLDLCDELLSCLPPEFDPLHILYTHTIVFSFQANLIYASYCYTFSVGNLTNCTINARQLSGVNICIWSTVTTQKY